MRVVQTLCSTHHQRSRVSPACLGGAVTVTAAGRLVPSLVIAFTLPLSCVPWLHAHYALAGYYGRSDSCRAALRAYGHEHRSVSRQVSLLTSLTLPAILSPTTLRRRRGFSFVHGFFQHTDVILLACPLRRCSSFGGMGYKTDFAQRSQARPSGWPNRVHVCYVDHRHCYGLAVHLRQLSTSGHHDAGAFGHRPAILRPDVDFHPAM